MMVRLQLDPTRTEILTGFFETYLKLNDQEEKQLQQEIGKLDPEEVCVMELISSYRKKGREEGEIEGKKEAICTFLESRFNGTVELEGKVRAINDLDLLNKLSKQIFAASSLGEIEDILN